MGGGSSHGLADGFREILDKRHQVIVGAAKAVPCASAGKMAHIICQRLGLSIAGAGIEQNDISLQRRKQGIDCPFGIIPVYVWYLDFTVLIHVPSAPSEKSINDLQGLSMFCTNQAVFTPVWKKEKIMSECLEFCLV